MQELREIFYDDVQTATERRHSTIKKSQQNERENSF